MKKLIVLLSVLVFLTTGCSSVYIMNISDIDQTIEDIIYDSPKMHNVNYEGYKYYVPNGLKFINKEEYNATFKDKYNNYYYIYVDAISFYHKVKSKYKKDNDIYLSKELKHDNKFGYFEITEKEDKYFIEAMYNYMKVEAYISKDTLEESVMNISSLLSNIKYNRKVLGTLIGNKKLNYKEEKYSILNPNKNADSFLDYVKEYEKDAAKDTKAANDEENLEIDNVE